MDFLSAYKIVSIFIFFIAEPLQINQESIIKKYEIAWSEYQTKLDQHFRKGWNIKSKTEQQFPKSNNNNKREQTDIFINNGTGSVLYHLGDWPIIAANPVYSFHLIKQEKIGDNKEFLLKNIFISKDKQKYKHLIFPEKTVYDYSKERTFNYSFSLFNQHIIWYFNRPYFKMTNYLETTADGKRVAKIEFESPHDVLEEPICFIQKGTFTFSMDDFLLPLRYEFTSLQGNGINTNYTINFFYSGEPLPILKEFTIQTERSAKKEFDIIEKVALEYLPGAEYFPVSRFTLSHYNLPEPAGITWARPIPNYIWIFAAVGILGSLSVFFSFMKKRFTKLEINK